MLLLLILASCFAAAADTNGRPGRHHSYGDRSTLTTAVSTTAATPVTVTSLSPVTSSTSSTSLKQSLVVVTLTGSPVYISGCPPITPVSTISYYSGTYLYYSPTATYNTTLTTYGAKTITISTDSTEGSFAGSYHTSYTATETVTTISIAPAATTITIPTPAGFTPVLCDAAFYREDIFSTTDYTLITVGYVVTETVWVDNPTSTYTTTWISTSTHTTPFYTGDYTLYTQLQVKVTSTRSEATSTVFQACASNNISPSSPFYRSPLYDLYVNQVAPEYDASGNPESYVYDTISVDAVDCCALCQKDPNCVGSSFNVAYKDRQICSLSIKTQYANQTCKVGYAGAAAIYQRNEPLIALSNSPCGQWQFPY